MNADLENLIVLQAQDLELQRLRAELLAAPLRVKAAATALTSAQKALDETKDRLAAEEKLRRAQESEIATHRSKLARLRQSLEGATSTQQVAAFEHEMKFAQNAIAELEELAFSSLERTELLETAQATAIAAAGEAELALKTERAAGAALTLHHEEMIAGVQRERGLLRAATAPPQLASYDRLAKTRGTAIAEALGNSTAGKCAACQMGVRPQRWQDLIGRDHPDEIFTCETCGRMLFWDPRRDTPRTWNAGDRLNSAQAGAAPSARGGVTR